MLISHSHKFIFIHVYKVGGTSIRFALEDYAHRPEAVWVNRLLASRLPRRLGLTPRLPYHRWRIFDNHATAREVRKQLPSRIFDNYFRFAFVRNPWDWQVSLYHYMLQTPAHHQHALIKSMNGFEEYILWRVKEDRKLQKDFVTDESGDLIVDFVGRYENLEEDFLHVCQALNMDAALPHLNRSDHGDHRSFYTDYSAKLVEYYFKEDIHCFGY